MRANRLPFSGSSDSYYHILTDSTNIENGTTMKDFSRVISETGVFKGVSKFCLPLVGVQSMLFWWNGRFQGVFIIMPAISKEIMAGKISEML